MADVTFNITAVVQDLNVSIATAAFIAQNPMPKIADPNWVDEDDGEVAPLVDKYPNVKTYVEAWGEAMFKRVLLKNINKGINILNEAHQPQLKEL